MSASVSQAPGARAPGRPVDPADRVGEHEHEHERQRHREEALDVDHRGVPVDRDRGRGRRARRAWPGPCRRRPDASQPSSAISASSANTPKMQLIASKATRAAQVRTPFGRLPREPEGRAGEGQRRQAGPHAADRRDADRGIQAAAEQDRDERLPHVEPEVEGDHPNGYEEEVGVGARPRRRRSRAASCCARPRGCARTRGVRGRRRRWAPRSGCSDDRPPVRGEHLADEVAALLAGQKRDARGHLARGGRSGPAARSRASHSSL